MGCQFSQVLPSLPTKTDLEQAKCEIIKRNEMMQNQQHDELLEKIHIRQIILCFISFLFCN